MTQQILTVFEDWLPLPLYCNTYFPLISRVLLGSGFLTTTGDKSSLNILTSFIICGQYVMGTDLYTINRVDVLHMYFRQHRR